MIKHFPFEVLVKICKNLKQHNIRQCLLVNKLWNRAARLFIRNALQLTLTEKSTLYQDLLQFPLLASRITKLTIKTNDPLYCILTLSLCPNILNLSFYKCRPAKLLNRLVESEYTLLPKVQDISAGPGNYLHTGIILPCKWRHRATITQLTVCEFSRFLRRHSDGMPEFISHFPKLEVLNGNGLYEFNLHRLLSHGKNLRSITLTKTHPYYDSKDDLGVNLSTKLKEFSVPLGNVHISVLKFLAGISTYSLKRFVICRKRVIVDKGQDADKLLNDIIDHFPNVKPEIFVDDYRSYPAAVV